MQLLVGVAGTLFLVGNQAMISTAKMKDEMQYRLKAQELSKKVSYLQEQMNVQSALYGKEIDSIADLKVNPSVLIVPSADTTARDEELYVKMKNAIEHYFTTQPPISNPQCSELATTGMITEYECDEIKARNIQTFKIENKVITYETDEKVQRHLDALERLNQVAIDANSTSYINQNLHVTDEMDTEWRDSKTKTLRNSYRLAMKRKDYFEASNIVLTMAYSSPQIARSMSRSVMTLTHAETSLSSSEKKNIVETLITAQIIAIKKSKSETLELYKIENLSIADLDINPDLISTASLYLSNTELQTLVDLTKGL